MSDKIEEIKEIVERWKSFKCVHCGEHMIYTDDLDNPGYRKPHCPKCVWNDSVSQKQYKALLDIGELVGIICLTTGASIA